VACHSRRERKISVEQGVHRPSKDAMATLKRRHSRCPLLLRPLPSVHPSLVRLAWPNPPGFRKPHSTAVRNLLILRAARHDFWVPETDVFRISETATGRRTVADTNYCDFYTSTRLLWMSVHYVFVALASDGKVWLCL